jgi:hypothetical protein
MKNLIPYHKLVHTTRESLKAHMSSQNSIGEIFTPPAWATFAAQKATLTQKWLQGATILDPFMGQGALLQALINEALGQGLTPDQLPLHRLFGFELQQYNVDHFLRQMQYQKIPVPCTNFVVTNTLFHTNPIGWQPDIIFTNPPWTNFGKLDLSYQEKLKPLFMTYNLVDYSQMLLGGSRVDLSALCLAHTLCTWVPRQNIALTFIPLSLLTSQAHVPFRNFNWRNNINVVPQWFYHLSSQKVFPIACDYGLLCLHVNRKIEVSHVPPARQSFPMYKWIKSNQTWLETPFIPEQTPYQLKKLLLPTQQKPRQGVNTGGANNSYIFDTYQPQEGTECAIVSNKHAHACLPCQWIAPLLTNQNLKDPSSPIKKWIFIPYNKKTGLPLSNQELQAYPQAWNYLLSQKEKLSLRKGVMLQKYNRHNVFYALLGISTYSFSAYKVVWAAMGVKKFTPRIVLGHHQANQALHAYIPAHTLQEAEKILSFLQSDEIKEFFKNIEISGTKSFAQPHRIKEFITFINAPLPIRQPL